MDQNLIDKFIKELDAHIRLLERDYASRKKLFDVDQFLRKNFSANDTNVYSSLVNLAKARCADRGTVLDESKVFESAAIECYELLKFFESNPSITLEELKEAFFTCHLANSNEVMKKYDRYKKAAELLNTLKQLFVRHQFRKAENNLSALQEVELIINRFKNLQSFLSTGELTEELEDLTFYEIHSANFSQEQWLEIFNYILLAQIKSYKKEEELARDESLTHIEETITNKAKELEEKILEKLPKESADILRPVEDVIPVEEQAVIVTPVTADEELVSLSDEELLSRYSQLEIKMHEHRKLGYISPTKEQSFSTLYESLNNGNVLENVKAVYKASDYLKFLFYCFRQEFLKIQVDMETQYPVSDLEEFTQLLVDDLSKPELYLSELEKELELRREEQKRISTQDVPTEVVQENPFKLIFYGANGTADILKDIKRFTPEKMQDLINILTKMEEGRLDKSMVISKQVPVAFKSIRGDYVFVTYRLLNDGHILVVTASNLDELSSNLHRLGNYDSTEETRLGSIIRDGSLDYIKLMKEQEQVRSFIFNQGFTKGV